MAIKLGNSDISSFKVGSGDCSIYLGNTLLYSGGTPPTPTYEWVSYSEGDVVPTSKTFYGIRANVDSISEPSDEVFVQITCLDPSKIFEIGWDGSEWYASYGSNIITDDVYDSETGYITIIFSNYNNETYNMFYESTGEDTIPFDLDLYEESQPTPTLQWVTFTNGDTIPSDLQIYGIKGIVYDLSWAFNYYDDDIYVEDIARNKFNVLIGGYYSPCYTGGNIISNTSVEYIFSNIGCSDYYTVSSKTIANMPNDIQLLIYA